LVEKFGSGPYATNNEQLILILGDLVDDEDIEEIVHELILQRLTMRSKEMEEYYSLILI
jgi:hypothetical protein